MTTLADVVSHFIGYCRPKVVREAEKFENIASLDEAIKLAATTRLPGHNRQPKDTLTLAAKKLLVVAGVLADAKDFHSLYETVNATIGDIPRMGKHGYGHGVAVYDIAYRIGLRLRLAPALVYLHNGSAKGARHFNVFAKGWADRRQFPTEFDRLTPAEIEDVLCIYFGKSSYGETWRQSSCSPLDSPAQPRCG